MPKRSSKEPKDINELAFRIVEDLTSDEPPEEEEGQKNPHAVALGRLGGLRGGKARAEKLSAKKRKEIARKAAISRWQGRVPSH